MRPHGGDLELALELADLADEIAMTQFRTKAGQFTRKDDGSPVTEADVAIESVLRDVLARARPGVAVFGEEFGGDRNADRVWLIDPIDGTGSFVEVGEDWATLIALVESGRPVVGVVSRPATGTRWWAAQDSGAFRDGRQIRASRTAELNAATMQEDFRISVGRKLDWNPVPVLARRCGAVRPWGDCFFFLAVAEGEVDFAVNWWAGSGPDLASQVCIVEASGGRFSDLEGRPDIDADVHVVTNGVLHEIVLHHLREILAAEKLDPSVEPAEDIPAIMAARAAQPRDPQGGPPRARRQ